MPGSLFAAFRAQLFYDLDMRNVVGVPSGCYVMRQWELESIRDNYLQTGIVLLYEGAPS